VGYTFRTVNGSLDKFEPRPGIAASTQSNSAKVDVASDASVLFRGLAFLCSMALVAYVIGSSPLDDVLDEAWINSEIRGQGFRGELLFVAFATVLASFGLPRQIVSFAAGYAFGFSAGLIFAMVATVCMCVLTFSCARFIGRTFVARRLPDKVRRVDTLLSHNPFVMTLLIRFLPVGNNLMTNLAAGVSSVRSAPFLVASAIGYVPQNVMFSLVGSGIEVDMAIRAGSSLVLFAASALLSLYLYRNHRAEVEGLG
jgi:uncharacterized membrane protein YdjX (TVP38/TMEM64 family)